MSNAVLEILSFCWAKRYRQSSLRSPQTATFVLTIPQGQQPGTFSKGDVVIYVRGDRLDFFPVGQVVPSPFYFNTSTGIPLLRSVAYYATWDKSQKHKVNSKYFDYKALQSMFWPIVTEDQSRHLHWKRLERVDEVWVTSKDVFRVFRKWVPSFGCEPASIRCGFETSACDHRAFSFQINHSGMTHWKTGDQRSSRVFSISLTLN